MHYFLVLDVFLKELNNIPNPYDLVVYIFLGMLSKCIGSEPQQQPQNYSSHSSFDQEKPWFRCISCTNNYRVALRLF